MGINLRLRIHFTILLVEFFSFLVIGLFTWYILVERAHQKILTELNTYNSKVQETLIQNTDDDTPFPPVLASDSSQLNRLIPLLREISEQYSICLSLFDHHQGKLLYATTPEVFQKGFYADRISPLPYAELKNGRSNGVFVTESIGQLTYTTSYFMLRNASGQQLGIIQIPLFRSGEDLRSETNAVITSIINLYIFIFLL